MVGKEVVVRRTIGERIEHSKEIDKVLAKCGEKVAAGLPVLQRGLRFAEGIRLLENLLDDDMMEGIMRLQDNPLGFMTDRAGVDKNGKKKTPYSMDVVRNATIEGLLRGVFPVDNQMNIIARRCYVAQQGFRHLVKEVDGLTDLDVNLRVPRVLPGEVIVEAWATWKIDGKSWSIDKYEIPVKVYPGQGSDLALGKANRRLHKRIYEKITGSYVPDGEVDPPPGKGDVIDVEPVSVSDIQARVAAANKAASDPLEVSPDPAPTEEPEKPVAPPVAAPVAGSDIPDDVFQNMGLARDYRPDAKEVWLLAMGDDTALDWSTKKFLAEHARHSEEANSPLKGLDALREQLETEAKGDAK